MKTLKNKLIALLTFILMSCSRAPALSQSIDTYIHPKAEVLLPVIRIETSKFAPKLDQPWVMPAIFDHETCPGYKSYKCWNTATELKNSREQGVGLGQMTRTWNTNGTVRFDNLANLRKLYPKELGALDWDTFKTMPQLQIRASTILFYDEYKRLVSIKSSDDRLRMARSAYNGGGGRVATARSRCKLTTNCNPQIWYGNVENHLPQSRVLDSRYGNRSMYQINVSYVKDTERRLDKFKPYFE